MFAYKIESLREVLEKGEDLEFHFKLAHPKKLGENDEKTINLGFWRRQENEKVISFISSSSNS